MAGIGPNVDWKVGETAHYLPAAEPPARKVTVLVVCHDASGGHLTNNSCRGLLQRSKKTLSSLSSCT